MLFTRRGGRFWDFFFGGTQKGESGFKGRTNMMKQWWVYVKKDQQLRQPLH